MFTDQFKHELNSYMKSQGEKLLSHQSAIARSSYNEKTGNLTRSLSSQPVVQNGLYGESEIEVSYPIYIRFLDMKKAKSRKKGKYVKKKKYVPIYNRYVYGYLKSDIWKHLMKVVPKQMIHTIESTIRSI